MPKQLLSEDSQAVDARASTSPLPIDRVLEIFGNPVSKKTVLKACHNGRLPYCKTFRINLIKPYDFAKLLEEGMVRNARQAREYRDRVIIKG